MTVAARLEELGITLPAVPAPVAAYVPAVRSGSHIYTSGQLPFASGELLHRGWSALRWRSATRWPARASVP